MELIGATPAELDEMTLSEIAVACMDPENPDGEPIQPGEDHEYAAWWVSLTLEQRLWAEP